MSKPKLKLSGQSNNVYTILVRAKHAARMAGWSERKIARFRKKAMKGNLDNLLQICMKYFDTE